jgi:PAS domain S-box-containing protein
MYSDENFKVLVMLAEDGIVRVDAKCMIRFINPCMLRMLYFDSQEELIGRSLLDIVEASDRGNVIKKFMKRKEGISENYVLSFVRKDGTAFTGYLSAVPIFAGKIFKGSFSVIKDMTREERFVKRLGASEARFRNLAKQLPAAICELDPDSSIRYANDFARRLLGGGCRGRTLRSFVPADELPRYDRILKEAFGGIEHEPFPMDLLRKERERFPALWSVALTGKNEGGPRASVVIVDIRDTISSAYTYDERFFAPYGLTKREQSVAKLLIAGSIYKEIACGLGVSLSTVRTHTMSLYRKMDIHSREELIDLALRWQVARYGKNILIERLCFGALSRVSAE